MSIRHRVNDLIKHFEKDLDSLNRIEISKRNLLHNYDLVQENNSNNEIWPVLKSNAYGHGIRQVADILRARKFEYIVVDSFYEALRVWKVNPKQKCLLIGYNHPNNLPKLKYDKIALTVYDRNTIKILRKLNTRIKIHLKINTGMNRQGIEPSETTKYVELIKKSKNIELEGICSHLADSDNLENQFTKTQVDCFDKCLDKVNHLELRPKYIHIAQTSGSSKIQNPRYNAVRLGIGLYGFPSLDKTDPAYNKIADLKPVLRLVSTLIHKRVIKKEDRVGYGCTFTAEKKLGMGLLPIGYNDGVDRRLSNKGFVRYKNKYLPIIGRISMNLTSIGLDRSKAQRMDEIEIISLNPRSKNSIENIARQCRTIPYDILVGLDPSTRRLIV